jgi:hypothetical protein
MNHTLEHYLALSEQELETLRGLFKRLPAFSESNPCTKLEEELLTLIFEHRTNEQ